MARSYLDHLKMEHAFWMDGAESLIPHRAYRHVVRMPDGSLLNRYWDDRDTPRDESWREDVETARHSGRPAMKYTATCGRAPRPAGTTPAAGCGYHAAGQHPHDAVYPHRPERLPVQAGDDHCQPLRPEGRSRDGDGLPPEGRDRRAAVNRYLWDDENGCFRDYDWRREQLALFSAASIVTLYVGTATHEQAERLADAVRARLLTPGIMATEYESGEQWDKPNGWRRCSGWRSVDLNVTAGIRWEMRLPGAGCRRSTTFTSSITS